MKCLGPNTPISLPLIPAFQDASGNNALPTPLHNLGTERGHESCVWPPSPRQTEALPALGALATSIWAAPPYSDVSSAPFQIQI